MTRGLQWQFTVLQKKKEEEWKRVNKICKNIFLICFIYIFSRWELYEWRRNECTLPKLVLFPTNIKQSPLSKCTELFPFCPNTGHPIYSEDFKEQRVKYFRSVLMMFYTSAMNPKYETFKEQVLSYLEEHPFNLNYSMLEVMGHLPIVSIYTIQGKLGQDDR